jgi:23S rRNA (cytidine1920-2'-O)/16S rRNA (cytidine1409-2'-O)-methyltransferase
VAKNRVDLLLFDRGMVDSRSLAQRLVMAGQVRVNGQLVMKPSQNVDTSAELTIDRGPRFVSRGGEKLEAALQAFGLQNLAGYTCVDVGASTGGFCDCLLQAGAEKVFAVDVGYGILHWKLRNDPRVVLMERTNARLISSFPEPIQLVTIDASFISLKILLPVVLQWFSSSGQVVALIKPQFEAGKDAAARGQGVIRDPAIHHEVLQNVLWFARQEGFGINGLIRSPLTGPKGNIEFLAHFTLAKESAGNILQLIENAMIVK